MERQPTHRIARETRLELGRVRAGITYVVVGSDDGLSLQTKRGGDVRILQASLDKTHLFRTPDTIAHVGMAGVENAQLGPWRPRRTARP